VDAYDSLAKTAGEMLAEQQREVVDLRARLAKAERERAEWEAGVVAANRISQEWAARGEKAEQAAAAATARVDQVRRLLCGGDAELYASQVSLEDIVKVITARG
jgi:hypothetical protein